MVGMIRKKWFLATLSSGVIIFSFILLMRATVPSAQKAGASSLASPNAVVVTESSAGKLITVAKVKLENPGYVVVHDGKGGSPGAILGYSKLLEAGDWMDVPVGLGRPVANGEILFAMLHFDDWDSQFNAENDMPVKDVLGNTIMVSFEVGTAVEGAFQVSY
jgi:hypothetical protein